MGSQKRPSAKPYSNAVKVTPQQMKQAFDQDVKITRILQWILPVLVLTGFTMAVYLGLSVFDFQFSDSSQTFLEATLTTNKEDVANAVGNSIELLAAILGLVLTVVAIVVQLAAQRYTPKLVDLFIADRINIGIFALMIFSVMYAVAIIFSIKHDFFPQVGVTSLTILTLIELALLLPYFNYVFKFLTPLNIITSIQKNIRKAILSALQNKGLNMEQYQGEVANALEQITDTVLSSNSQMDRNVSLMAINQMRDILLNYQKYKKKLHKAWYQVPPSQFISISSDFYEEILQRKIWVEAKAFMDMELIFKMSIKSMPDAISAIAYNTRVIGSHAVKNKDQELLKLVIEFYNTFLRISVNDKNQKAIYNLFYQYRILTEDIFSYDLDLAQKVLFYFKYYGQTAQQAGLWFILVTASFDLAALVEKAYERKLKNIDALMDTLLQTDDFLDRSKDILALKSVRKSQLKLAAYLVSRGEKRLVEKIVNDFKEQESFSLLIQLKDELLAVKDKKFWEVTDRGINFEYMDDDQKFFLNEFYESFILPAKDSFLS